MLKIGEKVIVDDKYAGYIVKVFPPNEHHSGRFIVHVHYEFGWIEREFWFGDWGVTVKEDSNEKKRPSNYQ